MFSDIHLCFSNNLEKTNRDKKTIDLGGKEKEIVTPLCSTYVPKKLNPIWLT